MDSFILLLFIANFHLAALQHNASSTGIFYRYNNSENGWYNGQISNPNIVYLRQNRYHNVPDRYHDFLNRTLARKPNGVCQKEIPVTLLLEPGQPILRGNGSNPTLSRITVCCQGYQRDPHIFLKCNPICNSECLNGICYAPNECICYPDHAKNLAGHCVSTCPIGCDNGVCRGNICVCNPGFALDKTGKLCIPVCEPSCGKGNCTATNICECNRGYELSGNGICIPKCTKGCYYGECVAPERCDCRPGYILQNSICSPICERGCIDGVCIAPNRCTCPESWTIDRSGTKCEPKCDRPCINGQCSRPNECECNPGYRPDSNDSHKCNPHCAEPCVNGVCSAPGMCLCNVGFVKDRSIRSSHICIPKK